MVVFMSVTVTNSEESYLKSSYETLSTIWKKSVAKQNRDIDTLFKNDASGKSNFITKHCSIYPNISCHLIKNQAYLFENKNNKIFYWDK